MPIGEDWLQFSGRKNYLFESWGCCRVFEILENLDIRNCLLSY